MEPLSIGDVCEIVLDETYLVQNRGCFKGMECTVIGFFPNRKSRFTRLPSEYAVKFSDGVIGWAARQCLRKKPPKSREDLRVITWADCSWTPEGVRI